MKCEQCGYTAETPQEGAAQAHCPNCGGQMRDDAAVPAADDPGLSVTSTHLKIAKTVNIGFGDFAATLATSTASKLAPDYAETGHFSRDAFDPSATGTATASSLNVASPDDEELTADHIYDEDDEYARVQAEFTARQKALDQLAAELEKREQYINKKLDEVIADKEFLRAGLEKADAERAAVLKQKDELEAKSLEMEKDFAARKKLADARDADLARKKESIDRKSAELEDLERRLDTVISDGSSASASVPYSGPANSTTAVPYSARLLRMNNSLERRVRILTRLLIGLAVLAVLISSLLAIQITELRRKLAAPPVISASQPKISPLMKKLMQSDYASLRSIMDKKFTEADLTADPSLLDPSIRAMEAFLSEYGGVAELQDSTEIKTVQLTLPKLKTLKAVYEQSASGTERQMTP